MNIVAYYLFDIYSVHVGPEEKNLLVNISRVDFPQKKMALSENAMVTNLYPPSKLRQMRPWFVICTSVM